MGRDGAVQALLAQDLGGAVLRCGFCGGKPAEEVLVGGSRWVGVRVRVGAGVPLLDGAASGLDLEAGGGCAAQAELEDSLGSHCGGDAQLTSSSSGYQPKERVVVWGAFTIDVVVRSFLRLPRS